MSISGSDSASCGHQTNPCKSIAQAVHRVNGNNGQVYLNGTGTEREPFNCSSGTQHGIEVQKNVSILGITSTPNVHISCFGGFLFRRTTERKLKIYLSGIVFQQTPLKFEDCNFVQLSKCSFRHASTAVKVYIKNISNAKLNIQSSSFLDNGVSCVRILLASKTKRPFLRVNISGTTFQRNGCIGNYSLKVGAVTIESKVNTISRVAQVEILCAEANYTRNCGHFLVINLPNVIVKGVFKDVTHQGNVAGQHRRRSPIVESLFSSKARKCYAKFANVSCNSNRLLRCIEIKCDESDIEIQNSSFYDQHIPYGRGAALSLEATSHAVLNVFDSQFKNNNAKAGGALYLHSEKGTIELLLTRVNFIECAAENYGGTMLIGSPRDTSGTSRKATSKLLANFNDIHVNSCSAIKGRKRRKCNGFHFLVFSGDFTISDSSWTTNRNWIDAAFVVENTGGKTDITISKCFFVNNSARITRSVIFAADNKYAGSVLIESTTFLNQYKKTRHGKKYSLLITPEFRMKLSDVVISSHNATGLGIFHYSRTKANKVNIDISNCKFLNSVQDIVVNLIDEIEIKFTITNSIFLAKNAGPEDVGILFREKRNFIMKNKTNTFIRLENVTFLSRPCNVFDQFSPGRKTIYIRNSTFKDAVCPHRHLSKHLNYFSGTGSVAILSPLDSLNKSGCVPQNTSKNVHRSWNYKSTVMFVDSTFEGNAGLKAGAVLLINGNVTFTRCKFKNNFANKSSGHVYAAYGTGRMHFKDCSFLTTITSTAANGVLFKRSTFLKSESWGPLIIENTSMVSNFGRTNRSPMVLISNGGYVDIDNKSSIECSAGSKLLFENTTHFQYGYQINGSSCRFNVTVLRYSCVSCSPGFYSLQRGVVRGLDSLLLVHCLPCPFGATCVKKNVAARPNFWGYPNSNNSDGLIFYPCPEGYCQTPPRRSDVRQYNHCVGNRSGFLCGKCASEYSETLFSTECRKKNQCNNHMFWIIMFLYTSAMAVYLLTKPPILSFLWKQIFWFRKREGYTAIGELDETMDKSSESDGYLKIVFYFYQAAELLMVGSAEHLFLHKIPFVLSIIEVFNFEIRTLQRPIGCPFAGLTAVTKEVLLSGTIFLILAELVTIYCLHFAFNKIRRKEGPSVIHFIAVIVELLLLGYERLAESSLNLMHCFPVGKENRLFIDAEIVCWQWWQYVFLAYIVVFVVPFIFVLYFGSSKLYAASISAKEFLGACIFPLPFLMYWSLRKVFLTRSNTSRVTQNNKDLLEVLHGPFRQPKDNDNGTLYWESVLIGRRFVLLCCHAFITNSMFRLICMSVACIFIMLHHVIKSPFKDSIANRSETASLLILTVMAVINLSKATLLSFGITIDGPVTSYLEVLDWFQVCVLAFVPSMLAVFLVVAVLSQLGRLILFLSKAIFRFAIQKERFIPLAFF